MDIKKLMRYGAGCLLMLFGAASCSTDDLGGTPDTSFPTEDGLYVSLRVDDKAPVTVTTRSEGVKELGENTVSRVDLFLFDDDGKLVKPVSVTDGNMTQVCLLSGSDWRNELTAENYTLYALANYHGETDLTTVNTLEGLRELTQTDEDILTTDKTFLMDGKVDFKPADLGTASVVMLDPIQLRRAAAKVEVTLTITDEAGFTPTGLTARVVNYATCTAAIDSDYPPEDRGLKSMKDYDDSDDSVVCQSFVDGGGKEAKLLFYTYVNDWTGSMQNETMLLVNIPYEEDDGTKKNNYYKVPLLPATTTSQARNTHYQIRATVNIIGNSKPEEPTPLKNAQCEMAGWTGNNVSVGDSDSPTYLILSEYLIDIRDTDGYDSLKFYSSSPIEVELAPAGEMDKAAEAVGFTYPGEGNLSPVFFVNAFDQRMVSKDKDEVKATPNSETAITGNIQIKSPKPDNLTIRYITLKVTNGDGLTRYVIVKQYPLTYITGVQGLYSYVEKNKDGNLITGKWPDKNLNSIKGQQIPNEIINGFTDKGIAGLDGHIGGGSNQKVDMKSKFYMADIIYEPDEGEEIPEGAPKKGVIYRIDWSYKKDDEDKVVDYVYTNGSARNNRMYNVNITATSGDYIISRPEMDGDVVNAAIVENNNYVSPSFMLASQLGNASTMSWEDARKNCQNYVEVSMDGHVYDDWRMPTRAELEIIAKYQNNAPDVMYQVLNSGKQDKPYYWAAVKDSYLYLGENDETESDNGKRRIRCVRDVKPGENVNN